MSSLSASSSVSGSLPVAFSDQPSATVSSSSSSFTRPSPLRARRVASLSEVVSPGQAAALVDLVRKNAEGAVAVVNRAVSMTQEFDAASDPGLDWTPADESVQDNEFWLARINLNSATRRARRRFQGGKDINDFLQKNAGVIPDGASTSASGTLLADPSHHEEQEQAQDKLLGMPPPVQEEPPKAALPVPEQSRQDVISPVSPTMPALVVFPPKTPRAKAALGYETPEQQEEEPPVIEAAPAKEEEPQKSFIQETTPLTIPAPTMPKEHSYGSISDQREQLLLDENKQSSRYKKCCALV